MRYEGEFSTLSAFRLSPAVKEADRETTEARGTGEATFTEDGVTLAYREEEGVSVSVVLAGDTLAVTRGGAVLRFVRGSMTKFVYRTAYGELPTEAYCEELSLQRKGCAALLSLSYVAVLGGMAQKNSIRFKITY